MDLRHDIVPDTRDLVDLYDAVGWSAYTRDPEGLHRAVAASGDVVTAWDGDTLVGLARALTDGETILYLQDVLVRPERQGQGIGGALLDDLLERYAHVRQRVLLSDGEAAQRALYRSRGYVPAAEVAGGPLVAFVRLDG